MRPNPGQILIIGTSLAFFFLLHTIKGLTPAGLYYPLLIISFIFVQIISRFLSVLITTITTTILLILVNLLLTPSPLLSVPPSLLLGLSYYLPTFSPHQESSPFSIMTYFLLSTISLVISILAIYHPDTGSILLSLLLFAIFFFQLSYLIGSIRTLTIHPELAPPFSDLATIRTQHLRLIQDLNESTRILKTTSQEVIHQAQSISTASQQMNASAQEISSTIQNISKGATEQSRSITAIAKSLEELLRITDSIVSHSKMTSVSAGKAKRAADEGMRLVTEASVIVDDLVAFTEQMRERLTGIRMLGDEVRKILDLIRTIADQTELLAINAAIEAARSGEAGKGFSVVAGEIRNLATSTLEASKRVEEMIREVDRAIDAMFETVDQEVAKVKKNQAITSDSRKQYEVIAKTVSLTSNQIRQIVDSTGRQSEETKEIAQQVDIITQVAEETASSTEEVAAAVEELTASLQELTTGANDLADLAKELSELGRSVS